MKENETVTANEQKPDESHQTTQNKITKLNSLQQNSQPYTQYNQTPSNPRDLEKISEPRQSVSRDEQPEPLQERNEDELKNRKQQKEGNVVNSMIKKL